MKFAIIVQIERSSVQFVSPSAIIPKLEVHTYITVHYAVYNDFQRIFCVKIELFFQRNILRKNHLFHTFAPQICEPLKTTPAFRLTAESELP